MDQNRNCQEPRWEEKLENGLRKKVASILLCV